LNKEDGGKIAGEVCEVVAKQDKGRDVEVDRKKSMEDSWLER
jgi:hypothetical protein